MIKIFRFLFLLIILLGCKDEKVNSSEVIDGPVEVETDQLELKESDYFSLSMDVKIEEEDTITLFYLVSGQNSISKENSVSVDVKGADYLQNLKFKLNKDVLPTRLILKLGSKEKTQRIEFDKLTLTYNGNSIIIEKEKFFSYFNPNKFIDYNQNNFTATVSIKNGDYNPFFVSRKLLEDKIDLELF